MGKNWAVTADPELPSSFWVSQKVSLALIIRVKGGSVSISKAKETFR